MCFFSFAMQLIYSEIQGEPLTYTNWYPGRYEDDFHDTEDCVLFLSVRHGQWDDVICNGTSLLTEPGKHHWICQYGECEQNLTIITCYSNIMRIYRINQPLLDVPVFCKSLVIPYFLL